ncbi:MAG: type II toxin-antitoxin system prevent-host-death family antitoxin [Acidobacteria bacterium]|nr:MAG: type II toxin-antitoxin system prevent-host-death family antitoxin [Acidobacteriota bacterium]
MKAIAAGKFKARCLKLLDEVGATREPIVITKRGRPVAKVVPAEVRPKDIFGCLAGVVEIVGDIESQVVTSEAWEALQ